MIDIEQTALRTLKQHNFAIPTAPVNQVHRVTNCRLEITHRLKRLLNHRFYVNCLSLVEMRQNEIVILHQFTDLFGKPNRIHRIRDPQTTTRHLILIRRTDPASSRPDFCFAARSLTRLV